MSAEHNHQPRCCCGVDDQTEPPTVLTCQVCPEHGALATEAAEGRSNRFWKGTEPAGFFPSQPATPYTEQETTDG